MLPQGLVWETPAITKAIERVDMLVLEAAGPENETRNAAIFEKLGRTTGLPDIAERVPPARRPALDRKSTRLNSSHSCASRMPLSACKNTLHTPQIALPSPLNNPTPDTPT